MPAYTTKGEFINYMTSKGSRKSKIVSITQINDRIYYRLENGDYIRDTQFGLIKTYESDDLLRLLGESNGGKIER